MTAALEGGGWSAARPGRTLPPGKTRYQFYRRLGWPQGRFGWVVNLVPIGIRSRTITKSINFIKIQNEVNLRKPHSLLFPLENLEIPNTCLKNFTELAVSVCTNVWLLATPCTYWTCILSFDVLLTVHLSIILVINQLSAQIIVLY